MIMFACSCICCCCSSMRCFCSCIICSISISRIDDDDDMEEDDRLCGDGVSDRADRALGERVRDWLSRCCCSCGELGGWFWRPSYESIDSVSKDVCRARFARCSSCVSSCDAEYVDISDCGEIEGEMEILELGDGVKGGNSED